MEKSIVIENREIRFKASGLTPVRYRNEFQHDVFTDIDDFNNAMKGKKGATMSYAFLDQIAYVMAKQADGTIPPYEEWLDSFDNPMSIMQHSQDIMDLWYTQQQTLSTAKKNNH